LGYFFVELEVLGRWCLSFWREVCISFFHFSGCRGYCLKNGALAPLGLGRGSGAYYGSVGEKRRGMVSGSAILRKKGLYAKNSLDRLVEYALEISLRQGGALEVLDGLDLFGDLDCLLILYGLHLALAQLLLDLWVVAQVELGADEDDGDAGRVVLDLGVPL
jgi:hypothetical protein